MIIKRLDLSDSTDIRLFINQCESNLEAVLNDAALQVSQSDSHIITLSGPSCSGKTTAAEKLVRVLSLAGKSVHVISIDNYYYNRDYLESISEDGKIDFDSPKTIDLDFLEETVCEIDSGKKVRIPLFDFKTGKRESVAELLPDKNDVYIFEGIQAIYPSVTALLSHYSYKSMFISIAQELQIGDTLFGARELRFFRRMVRDHRCRGASPEFTFALWQSVCENEDKHILPYANTADISLNSLLGYEPCVIKPYLLPLLDEIPSNSPYRAYSDKITERFESIQTIDQKYVPENSLFREFIG